MIVITNSGPLIALGKLSLLNLLEPLYKEVMLPARVYDEVIGRGTKQGYLDTVQAKLAVHRGYLLMRPVMLNDAGIDFLPLDPGEKAVLNLALENKADLVLMDDMLARKQARNLGFKVTGTLGIIVSAYRKNLLSLDELRIIFDTIIHRNDIWIAEGLCRIILEHLEKD